MALSSFGHLLKQVESLKTENSHLRQELQDNSSHLTKLENEASNMKDVLSHLQLTMEERYQTADEESGHFVDDGDAENGFDAPYGQPVVTDTANNSLHEANDNSYDDDPGGSRTSRDANASVICSSADNGAVFKLLDHERSSLMKEIESEEQHRVWFYQQLEIITSKLETLPLTDTYNLQTDMARRQLEYEAQQLQGAMTEKLGSTEQSSQRQEARLRRIRTIESEMLQLQRQQQVAQQVSAVNCKDVGTCTTLNRAIFAAVPGQELGGFVSERMLVKASDGNYVATVAVQTADVSVKQEDGHVSGQTAVPGNADVASSMYHGAWPIHKDMNLQSSGGALGDVGSVMSFTSTNTRSSSSSQLSGAKPHPQQLGTKVEMVYSLLSMLGTHDKDDMSRTLLAMSSSQDSCIAMRQSGCLPLLIQLLHGSDKDSGLLGNTRGSAAARARASAALHNIVHSNPDDKRGRREARTLRLLEQIRAHCDQQRGETVDEEEGERAGSKSTDIDHHPGPAIAALMKLSFDEDYRHAICTLGGLQAMAELLEVDHMLHGNTAENYSVTVRRYACMALTNLTFGDGKNKALLCSMRPAMEALVVQLRSANEDLCQGAASVLRNLSWRADLASKKTLREVGAVTTLMESAMAVKKETTLKSILSALWNLSSHCSENKAEICAVKGALEFLVSLLTFKSAGKTHAIVENGGGILRNVSSQVAVREDYRRILRQKGCLQILLSELRSTSLTVVSNACGTLWNLSARCAEDQDLLRELGAVSMLRNLVHSKHRMIAMGSSAALRNLLSSAGSGKGMDCDRSGNSNRPTLSARKQRALEEELEAQNLAETCENVESPRDSPTDSPHRSDADGRRFVYPYDTSLKNEEDPRRTLHKRQVATRCGSSDSADGRMRSPQRVPRTGSQDSVTSTHSDISHDRSRVHHMLAKSSHLLHRRQGGSLERNKESSGLHRVSSDHACSALEHQGKTGEMTRNGQSSRIVRYMQEVAMLAGVGGDMKTNPSEPSIQQQQGPSQKSHSGFSSHSQPQTCVVPPVSSNQRLYEHLAKKNVNLGLGYDSDSSEQPVDYSLKYQDTALVYPPPSVLSVNVHPASLQNGSLPVGHSRPALAHVHSASTRMTNPQLLQYHNCHPGNIRINNYIGSTSSDSKSAVVRHTVPTNNAHSHVQNPHSFVHPPHRQQPQQPGSVQRFHGQHKVQRAQGIGGQYCAYAETDLDSMDEQPTDFSLRYAEDHSDDQDQPVNYSLCYPSDPDPDCVQCKYEEARRTNERLEQSVNDDQVLTFCTEGTPFLSTATSLTDLTGGKHDRDDGEEGEQKGVKGKNCQHHAASAGEEEGDELHNYSAQYGESEDTAGRRSCAHAGATVQPLASCTSHRYHSNSCQPAQSAPQQSFHNADDDSIPPDQMKTYYEEGTPVCFSRVSSLSSLHSSEARDNIDQGRPIMLQSIEESDKGEMSTSVIENKNAIYMKTALVDRDQRRNRSSGEPEKEAKTVTFDESRQQVEETPLMFSRCSSLGSLSSFDTQSVHSSVVSEYSRRASQVVSPSELPDSPSETMPPSPTRLQSPSVVTSVCGETSSQPTLLKTSQVKNKVNWQKGAEDMQVDDKTAKLLDILRSSVPQKHLKADDNVSISGKSEVPVVYADEGTPPVFSETSSLSALTLDGEMAKETSSHNALTFDSEKAKVSVSQLKQNISSVEAHSCQMEEADSADVTLCETQNSTLVEEERDSSMSDVSEGEEDILAQCINAAMPAPTNTNRKMRKSSSDNTIKKKSALPKPETSVTPRSRLPTKIITQVSSPVSKSSKPPPTGKMTKPESNQKKTSSPASSGFTKQSGNASKPPRPTQTRPLQNNLTQRPSVPHRNLADDDYATDTLRTFATEGTPLNFSAATSLSDLSSMTEAPGNVRSPASLHKSPEDCKSDNSSLCEESEQQLLSDMIQAAMPKSRVARRLDTDRLAAGRNQPVGNKAPSRGIPARNQPMGMKAPRISGWRKDELKVSTSRPIVQMEVPFLSSAVDTTKTYATEGTPNNFSAATSLSDLTIDSVDDGPGSRGDRLSNGRSLVKSSNVHTGSAKTSCAVAKNEENVFSVECPDSPHVYGVEGTPTTFSRSDSLSSIDMLEEKSDSHSFFSSGRQGPVIPHASERQVIGQSSEESSVKSEKQPTRRSSTKDETRQFELEDTPVSFSRNSSLSSLASGGRAREPQPEEEPQISRTSSMGSLSAESAGFDPTPSEQALLDQCISAAMPKRRPSRPDERLRRHSRPTKNEGCALQEGGSLKNSVLEIQGQFGDKDIGETRALLSENEKPGHQDKLMTRSCSDALDIQSDDGGGRSRFSSWCKTTQLSSDEMKSGVQKKASRSHSQDNFLKTQKEICNRITQSGESSASTSSSASHYAHSCTTSVIHVKSFSADNRLLDLDQDAPSRRAAAVSRDQSLLASFTDSCSSGEKADSEKSVFDDPMPPACHRQRNQGEHDMDCNQDQTVLEVMQDQGDQTMVEKESSEEERGSQCDISERAVHYEDGLEERLCFGSGHASFDQEEEAEESGHASFEQEITPEDELLLQENASLIVCEIVTKRDMTGSALDEDLFIENETISLVSNDYTSDTASEVSVSWSTNSEKMSEHSCSQTSQAETVGSGSARVVKPGSKIPGKKTSEEDDDKVVRGRRKPLYSKQSSLGAKSPGKTDYNKPRSVNGAGANSRPISGAGNTRPTTVGVGNSRSPGGAGRGTVPPKKNSPRTQIGQTKSNLTSPKTPPQSNQKVSSVVNGNKASCPKVNLTKAQSPAGSRPGSGSGIPRSSARGGNTPPSKIPSATNRSKDTADRPKPLSKQATFVKDSALVTKDIKPDSTSPNNVRLRARSASRGRSQSCKRNSGNSAGNAQRNSTGSPPEAWTKALDSFNFIVDKSGENGLSAPYKQIQMQRNAKDSQSALKQSTVTTSGKQPRPSNIARPQQAGTPPKTSVAGKSSPGSSTSSKTSTSSRSNVPARTNLNKSGSASSLRKTGSGSSLTKTSSGSSLNKGNIACTKKPGVTPPSKADIKKSESNSSLRRGSDNSRPSTPIGRRSSNPTAAKQCDKPAQSTDETKRPAGGKKQKPSKIASLWKKEGVERSLSMEEPSAFMNSYKPKTKSSSLPAAARNMSISSGAVMWNYHSSGEEQSSSSLETIPRSSTYDKFPTDKSYGNWQNSEERAYDDALEPSGGGMLELCDPSANENGFISPGNGEINLDDAYIQDEEEAPKPAENEPTLTCSVDSLEETFDDNALSVLTSVIDSSTWRKKQRPSKEGDITLQLPNADETCRSMCSFLNPSDSQNESLAKLGDVSVWQKGGDDSVISEVSFAVNAPVNSKKSKNKKSVAKSIKSTFAGLKFFGSKQSKDQSKSEKAANKKSPTEPDIKVVTTSTGTSTATKTITVPTSKPSPGAIVAPVAPFNYSPPSVSHIAMTTSMPAVCTTQLVAKETPKDHSADINVDSSQKKVSSGPKHMTKTEMLLARRRQSYLTSNKQEEGGEGEGSQRGCMVTTV